MQKGTESNPLSSMLSLDQLAVGTVARIMQLSPDATTLRLLSMGVVPGSQVEILRRRSKSGTLYLKANRINIALRTNEAKAIYVSL